MLRARAFMRTLSLRNLCVELDLFSGATIERLLNVTIVSEDTREKLDS